MSSPVSPPSRIAPLEDVTDTAAPVALVVSSPAAAAAPPSVTSSYAASEIVPEPALIEEPSAIVMPPVFPPSLSAVKETAPLLLLRLAVAALRRMPRLAVTVKPPRATTAPLMRMSVSWVGAAALRSIVRVPVPFVPDSACAFAPSASICTAGFSAGAPVAVAPPLMIRDPRRIRFCAASAFPAAWIQIPPAPSPSLSATRVRS